MTNLLDPKLTELAKKLVQEDKVIYTLDAEKDIQNWDFTKDLLKHMFNTGILIAGKELYPLRKELHDRNYCISCYKKPTLFSLTSKHYVNIAWNFTNDHKEVVIFIHTSPCSGQEIKIYKQFKP